MRQRGKPSLLVLIGASAVLAVGSQRYGVACSCDMPTIPFTTAEEFDRHDLVFAGVLEEAAPLTLPYLLVAEKPPVETTVAHFRVTQAWKGVSEPTVVVFSAAPGGSCGYPLKEGVTYLVFARQEYVFRNAPYLGVSRCSPTAPLADAARRVKQLNRLVEKREKKRHDS